MDQDPVVPKTSRRHILGAAAAAATAAIAARIAGPTPTLAATGDNLVLGNPNEATAATTLVVTGGDAALSIAANSTANAVAFNNNAPGDTLVVQATAGVGVQSLTYAGPIGLAAGNGGTVAALKPDYVTETGILGVGTVTDTSNSTGVWGEGDTGVYGYGGSGVWGEGFYGVRGLALGATGSIGVKADATTTAQYALVATGKVKLSRSGRTYVSASASSRKVTLSGVTSSTHVLAQIATNRAGYYVQSVVPTTGSFTIYLNKAVPGTTYVHWVVLDA